MTAEGVLGDMKGRLEGGESARGMDQDLGDGDSAGMGEPRGDLNDGGVLFRGRGRQTGFERFQQRGGGGDLGIGAEAINGETSLAVHLEEPAGLEAAEFLAGIGKPDVHGLRQAGNTLSGMVVELPKKRKAGWPGQDPAGSPQGRIQGAHDDGLHFISTVYK